MRSSASFNYYNTKTFNEGAPGSFTGQTAAGGRNVSVAGIFLPVYVCPQGTAVVGTNPTTGNIEGNPVIDGVYESGWNADRRRDAQPEQPLRCCRQFGAALGAPARRS